MQVDATFDDIEPQDADFDDPIAPTDKQITTLSKLEEIELELREKNLDDSFIESLRSTYVKGLRKAKHYSFSATAAVTAAFNESTLTSAIESWMSENWNTLSTAYTKAMDGAFAEGLKSGADYVSPSNHRLFDGHSLTEAWSRCKEALPNDTTAEELAGYVQAMLSDMSSKVGLPLMTMDQSTYVAIVEKLGSFGIKEEWIHDVLHFNTHEVVSTLIPGIGLLLNWNEKEKENFARICGGALAASIATANPIMVILAIVCFALGYDKARLGGNERSWLNELSVGGAISATLFALGTLVGPVFPFLLVGVVVVLVLVKKQNKSNHVVLEQCYMSSEPKTGR